MDLATNLIKDAMMPSTQHHEAHVSPETLEENIPGAFPDVDEDPAQNFGKDEAGPKWTTEVVRPRHLGNEGKALGAGNGAEAEALPVPAREDKAVDEVDSSRENPGRHSGPGPAGAQDPMDRPGAPPSPAGEDRSEARAGRGPEAPSIAGAAPRRVDTAARGREDVAPSASGGIRNGVRGAGSGDPRGEGSGSPHERQSRYRRGDVRSSIPSVRESGLGQGGIHNGVVGHGSREGDDRRRREAGGDSAGAGLDDRL